MPTVSATAIEALLKQEWFEPETLKSELLALKRELPNLKEATPFTAINVAGQALPLAKIAEDLKRFNAALGFRVDPKTFSLLNFEHLNLLEKSLTEVTGAAPLAPPPNIPVNLRELVKIHQAALEVQAQAAPQGADLKAIFAKTRDQIKLVTQLNNVRLNAAAQVGWAAKNSQYVTDLAMSLGIPRAKIEALIDQRVDQIATQSAVVVGRYQQLGVTDPQQLTALLVKSIRGQLKLEKDVVFTALAKNQPDAKKAFQALGQQAGQVFKETQSSAQTVAADVKSHPAFSQAAETQAKQALDQSLETNTIVLPPGEKNKFAAKSERLIKELVKHRDHPQVQLKIVAGVLKGATPEQQKNFLAQIQPDIARVAAASNNPLPSEFTDPAGLISQIRSYSSRFPPALIKNLNKITPEQWAAASQLAQALKISPEAAVLTIIGADAQKLSRVSALRPLPPDHPLVLGLNRIAGDQTAIYQGFKNWAVPPQLENGFRSLTAGNLRGRVRPIRFVADSFSSLVSGWRVRSGLVNSIFNFVGSVGRGFRTAPAVIAAPFRAVGGLVSTGWNNVKSWAGTQIKSGLAKAGSWLAKKGLTAAAAKLGGATLAKGTAALLVQAAPVVGQVAAVLTALSVLGDIGKFLWENKKEIGLGLGGLFFLGQMLLAKALVFLGQLGTLAATTGIGALIGTMILPGVGTVVGAGIGFLTGLGINAAGGLGAALSGIGSWLGSAAAGLGSFLGSLTAPSLLTGVGSTIATVGVAGLGIGFVITTFFVQPTTNSALFVPGEYGPGGGPLPIDIVGSCPIPAGFNLCGSLGSQYQAGCIGGHGSNEYWSGQGGSVCRWGLPSSDADRCTYNAIPGNTCNRSNASCPDYGYASDFTYYGARNDRCDKGVYLPFLNGHELTWELVWSAQECGAGCGEFLRATDGNTVYEMYMTHLNAARNGGKSGNITGTLYCGVGITTPHVHVEIKINGEYVRPDFLCEGDSGGIYATPTSGGPSPTRSPLE